MSRWSGIKRPYTREDVHRLQGTLVPEHTFAKRGAEKLWQLLDSETFVPALGALTGNQAVQQVRAGLKAIYVSGWQVAPTQISRARFIRTRACTHPTAFHIS
jgi:isocitrate lyase